MILDSIKINRGNKEKVKINITDNMNTVIDKLNNTFKTNIKVTRYKDWEYKAIEVDQIGLYDDCNTSLMLVFDSSDSLVAVHQSDYSNEEGVATIQCIDSTNKLISIDYNSKGVCDFASESIVIEGEDAHIHREILQSSRGNWVMVYPETSTTFMTVALVLKEHADELEYELFGVNILTFEK